MTDTMKKVVDADTHISESQGMWEFLDREMYHRRPVLMSVPEDTLYGERNAFWLIDGNIFPKPRGRISTCCSLSARTPTKKPGPA